MIESRFAAWARRSTCVGRWNRAWRLAVSASGLAIVLALGASGCARAQARGAAAGPPLNVPEPPPRVITPADEPLAAAPAIPDPPPVAAPPPTPVARVPLRRPAGTAPEAEPKPEPAPPPAAPAPPAEPPRELRAASSARDAAAERTVRDTLARAARDLSRVDYGKLGSEGRAQYDQSKRFAQQAEQALKDRNFVFASTLADKAATLAAGLLGR